ncbi:MAG: response regulator [Candidatus Dormibacteria bacterium]
MAENNEQPGDQASAQLTLEAANQALAAAKAAVLAAQRALAMSQPETTTSLSAAGAEILVDAARHETKLREAELNDREAEIAARAAAMAQYTPMEPARSVPARPQAELNGYTVLVVDDEEQVRALTVRILTRYGYRVLEASGVEIALGVLDEPTANVDLVLSDVAMPGLSGKDLFRAISQSRPGLPVVFMSGYALGVYAPDGLIEEGVRMLPKPFTQEALLGFVTEALDGAAPR